MNLKDYWKSGLINYFRNRMKLISGSFILIKSEITSFFCSVLSKSSNKIITFPECLPCFYYLRLFHLPGTYSLNKINLNSSGNLSLESQQLASQTQNRLCLETYLLKNILFFSVIKFYITAICQPTYFSNILGVSALFKINLLNKVLWYGYDLN